MPRFARNDDREWVFSLQILVNEQPAEANAGETAFALRDRVRSNADVVVVNGAPVREDVPLCEGDEVVLIVRGEKPKAAEMEALMAARHTPGVHRRLKETTVGIAGLGGLGSAVAIALARIGVGKLVLVDFDVVEPSNLNRQQYFIDQIGMYKTEAMRANLARINPYVTVETKALRIGRENVLDLFRDVDALVEAFDVPECKAMIAESFGRARPDTPLIMATGLAGHAPSNTVQTRMLGKSRIVVGDLETAAAPGTGLMAPRVGVAAHHQANAVLRVLLGEPADRDE